MQVMIHIEHQYNALQVSRRNQERSKFTLMYYVSLHYLET